MITMEELLDGHSFKDQPTSIRVNLNILLGKINAVRLTWGKPMIVTSGLRTPEDQLRIYKAKGITDLAKIPMGSKHLSGQAVDIYDPGLLITGWLKVNPKILENAGLWCELGNSNWLHAQSVPPLSGARWFKP